jgi:hypothetical protein
MKVEKKSYTGALASAVLTSSFYCCFISGIDSYLPISQKKDFDVFNLGQKLG